MKHLRLMLSILCAGAVCAASAQNYRDAIQYFKAGQNDNALELFKRNLSNADTDKAASYYYMGRIALENKNKAEASKQFDAGVAANPEFAYNYAGLGEIALLDHNSKEAERLFKEAESRGKKDAGVQIAIARAYYDADPALYAKEINKRIEKARKVNEKSPEIYMFEGDQYADSRDWGRAAGRYEMATNFDPKAVEGYVKGANMLFRLNPDESINMLKRLLTNNPASALGQKELAEKYYEKGDYKNASAAYASYVDNANHFKRDEDRYAFLLFYGGDFKKGYDYASKLLAANSSNFTAMRYQFMNAAQLPELKDQLVPMADKLIATHKLSKENRFAPIDFTLIADEYKKAGRADEAINVLKEAIEEMPDNAAFNKQLAMTYVENNKFADASDAFEGFIKKTPEPGYVDYLQQATFAYYGAIDTKTSDPARSKAYFDKTLQYAQLAQDKNAAMHKSAKLRGDVKIQNASKADAPAVAFDDYAESIRLLEALPDTKPYASDAKVLYNYMGNYYLNHNDKDTAKKYFNKYLEYDPDNADYRKFVESL